MKVNLELYHIFYVVATNGSISKAAEVLFLSQPAVTFQIKNLEEALGMSLFVRSKQGVSLTDEGKVLYDFVEKAIASITNAEHALTNLKNLDSGTIRIGASTTVSRHVLMKYLESFHENYPNIDIQIVNNLTESLLKELRNGNLDMLVLNLPMPNYKDIKITPVMKVQDIFVGNKKYFDLTKGHIKLENLTNYPLLFQKLPSNTRAFLNEYLKNNQVNLNPKLEVVSYNLIMDLVKSGFGIGYATREFIQNEIALKQLYEIKVTPKIPERYIGIATLNKAIPNYSVQKLMDIILKNN